MDGSILNYGSLVLSDLAAYLTLAREPHGRRGRLNVARLLDKQGDAKLTDHVPTLGNSEKARVFSLYDRCRPVTASVHETAAPRLLGRRG